MSRPACLLAVLLSVAPIAPLSPVAAQEALAVPELSPPMRLEHTLGLTKVELAYGAPSVRGRTIFGDKVPWGAVWRAGANATTAISFSTDVLVEGQPLPAGSYGLHTRPGRERWEVFFNTVSNAWGSYSHDPAKDALRVAVTPREAPFREQLRYAFEDVGDDGATLVLHWERTEVPVRIGVDLPALVLAPVRAAVAANETHGWKFWCDAVEFGRSHDVPAAETMDWLERSLAARQTFTNLWTRFELLSEAGKKPEADQARADAMKKVTVEELSDLAYRYHLRGDFANAAKVFEMVVAQDEVNWWPYTMLATARRELGDSKGAAEALRSALAKGPDPATRSEIEAGLALLDGE